MTDLADPPRDLDHRAHRWRVTAAIYRDDAGRIVVEVDDPTRDPTLCVIVNGEQVWEPPLPPCPYCARPVPDLTWTWNRKAYCRSSCGFNAQAEAHRDEMERRADVIRSRREAS